jgi:hypothetical protein
VAATTTGGQLGATRFLHNTAEAWVDGTGAVTNSGQINALANLLAADLYAWGSDGLDLVLPSIQPWTPEGYHDVTWAWSGSASPAATGVQQQLVQQFELLCQPGGNWSCSGTGFCAFSAGFSSVSCDPFQLSATGVNVAPQCCAPSGGTVSILVF